MAIARRGNGLSRITVGLLVATIIVGLIHHTDHILRVDHSGWPFRRDVNPFTFSLLAYPILFFALAGPRRLFWPRWMVLAIGAGFTLFAHVMIESPQMQYAMWANDRSLEPHHADLRNLLDIHSSGMGMAAVTVSMTLNILLAVAAISMLADGIRLQPQRADHRR